MLEGWMLASEHAHKHYIHSCLKLDPHYTYETVYMSKCVNTAFNI